MSPGRLNERFRAHVARCSSKPHTPASGFEPAPTIKKNESREWRDPEQPGRRSMSLFKTFPLFKRDSMSPGTSPRGSAIQPLRPPRRTATLSTLASGIIIFDSADVPTTSDRDAQHADSTKQVKPVFRNPFKPRKGYRPETLSSNGASEVGTEGVGFLLGTPGLDSCDVLVRRLGSVIRGLRRSARSRETTVEAGHSVRRSVDGNGNDQNSVYNGGNSDDDEEDELRRARLLGLQDQQRPPLRKANNNSGPGVVPVPRAQQQRRS